MSLEVTYPLLMWHLPVNSFIKVDFFTAHNTSRSSYFLLGYYIKIFTFPSNNNNNSSNIGDEIEMNNIRSALRERDINHTNHLLGVGIDARNSRLDNINNIDNYIDGNHDHKV